MRIVYRTSGTSNVRTHKGTRREQGIENLFHQIMTGNFPNLAKEILIDTQVQQVRRVSNRMKPVRPMPRHIIIKMPQVKDESKKQQEKSS